MYVPAAYLPALFSLSAMCAWGISDFAGGLGVRRVNAFLFTSVVHLSGIVAVFSLARLLHAPFPQRSGALWALAAGTIGGVSLALFYRALSSGKMGLTAPVTAVLGAGIPTVATSLVHGFPGYRHVLGFVLAGIGVWLISRTEAESGRPEGLGLAVIAGLGFAAFYLCVNQARDASALWVAWISRCGSFLVTGALVLLGKQVHRLPRSILAIAIVTGFLDIAGTVLFVCAAQAGRLDSAVVLSSLYPTVTVLLARVFLHEHFSRGRTVGMLAALVAVPLVAG